MTLQEFLNKNNLKLKVERYMIIHYRYYLIDKLSKNIVISKMYHGKIPVDRCLRAFTNLITEFFKSKIKNKIHSMRNDNKNIYIPDVLEITNGTILRYNLKIKI